MSAGILFRSNQKATKETREKNTSAVIENNIVSVGSAENGVEIAIYTRKTMNISIPYLLIKLSSEEVDLK